MRKMSKNPYFVYILKCYLKKSFSFYTGYSKDISKRIEQHKKSQSRYMKRFKGEIELVYFETFPSKKEALKRENEIKKLSKSKKKELINSFS